MNNAFIGKVNPDQSITGTCVYAGCNIKGDRYDTPHILNKYYSSPVKASQLIKRGEIRTIEPRFSDICTMSETSQPNNLYHWKSWGQLKYDFNHTHDINLKLILGLDFMFMFDHSTWYLINHDVPNKKRTLVPRTQWKPAIDYSEHIARKKSIYHNDTNAHRLLRYIDKNINHSFQHSGIIDDQGQLQLPENIGFWTNKASNQIKRVQNQINNDQIAQNKLNYRLSLLRTIRKSGHRSNQDDAGKVSLKSELKCEKIHNEAPYLYYQNRYRNYIRCLLTVTRFQNTQWLENITSA